MNSTIQTMSSQKDIRKNKSSRWPLRSGLLTTGSGAQAEEAYRTRMSLGEQQTAGGVGGGEAGPSASIGIGQQRTNRNPGYGEGDWPRGRRPDGRWPSHLASFCIFFLALVSVDLFHVRFFSAVMLLVYSSLPILQYLIFLRRRPRSLILLCEFAGVSLLPAVCVLPANNFNSFSPSVSKGGLVAQSIKCSRCRRSVCVRDVVCSACSHFLSAAAASFTISVKMHAPTY